MGRKASTSATSRRSGQPSIQKLKDSCDMCSSSKVKCNKEKPICSRCRKLDYPCFYSPARRIGRPHPNRLPTNLKSPEPPSVSSPTEVSSVHKFGLSNSQGLQPSAVGIQMRQLPLPMGYGGDNESHANYSHEPLPWLGHPYLSSTGIFYECGSRAIATVTEELWHLNESFIQADTAGISQIPLDNLEYFNLPSSSNDGSNWVHTSHQILNTPMMPLDDPLAPKSTRASSTRNQGQSEFPSSIQKPRSNYSESECVKGIIEILRRLQISRNRVAGVLHITSVAEWLTRMQTTPSAINRLATILICPCSQKPYVAILIAAACMAIMDIYDSLFHLSQDSRSRDFVATRAPGGTPAFFFPISMDICMNVTMEQCLDVGMGMDADSYSTSVLAFEELPKLASVVILFARRCQENPQAQSASTLAALADLLKARLNLVTNEVFERTWHL